MLFLELLVEFVDVRLQVSTSSQDPLNLSVQRSLLLPEFEQLLGVPHRDVLLEGDLLLKLLLLGLLLLEGLLGNYLGSFKLLCQFELVSEFDVIGLELDFFILESLLLLQQFLVSNVDYVSFVGPFG